MTKRHTRAAHVWAGVAALAVPILLVVLTRFLPDREFGVRTVGFLCGCWLFYAFRVHVYQLGDLLESKLGLSGSESSRESGLVKASALEDWPSIGVNVFAFLALVLLVNMAARSTNSVSEQDRLAQNTFGSLFQDYQSTPVYWQSAVANLHAIRFQTLSGQEPAGEYYEQLFRQLRLLTEAAKAAPTVNVDPELVQLASRHLMIEDRQLQWKQRLDEFMQKKGLPSPTDAVYQRGEMTQQLLGLAQNDPETLKQMPVGRERNFLEAGLAFERKRLEQLREIEIMQAVLQERYPGVAFPLPTITP